MFSSCYSVKNCRELLAAYSMLTMLMSLASKSTALDVGCLVYDKVIVFDSNSTFFFIYFFFYSKSKHEKSIP